jgi:hypothetical protein
VLQKFRPADGDPASDEMLHLAEAAQEVLRHRSGRAASSLATDPGSTTPVFRSGDPTPSPQPDARYRAKSSLDTTPRRRTGVTLPALAPPLSAPGKAARRVPPGAAAAASLPVAGSPSTSTRSLSPPAIPFYASSLTSTPSGVPSPAHLPAHGTPSSQTKVPSRLPPIPAAPPHPPPHPPPPDPVLAAPT